MFEKVRTYLHRRLQRVLLSNPEKAPERIALGMAAIVLLSIVVTYNFLYEKKIREEGIKPKKVTDLFRERAAKQRLEHLELQRTILQARNKAKTDNGEI